MNIDVSTNNFVNFKYIQKHRIFTMFIIKRVNLRLINDSIEYVLTKMIMIKIRFENHINKMLYLITSLNKFDLILKMF